MNKPLDTLYSLRKTPKQARAKATVKAVLDAAAQVLVSQGYANASTNHIAEQAGVSIGSLYEYFPGKEAIFAELRRREGLKNYAKLTGEPRPTVPEHALRHLVTTYIACFGDNLELMVALENEVPRFAIADMEDAVLEDYLPMSNEFLEHNRDSLKPHNDIPFISEFLARVVASTIVDYAKFSPERLSTPELAEALVEMVGGWLIKNK